MSSENDDSSLPYEHSEASARDIVVVERLCASELIVPLELYNVIVDRRVELRLLAALREKVGEGATVNATYRSFDGLSFYMPVAWRHSHRRRVILPGRDGWVKLQFLFQASDDPVCSLHAWAVRMAEAMPESIAKGKAYVAVYDMRLRGEFDRLRVCTADTTYL